MAVTARALQSALVDALATSSALQAQCVEYFDEPAAVSGGGSGRQGQTAAPGIAVVMWSRSRGEDDQERQVEGTVLLSLTDDSIVSEVKTVVIEEGEDGDEDITADVLVETFGGPTKLEVLLELVSAEILGLSSEIMITELNYAFEPLEYFPLFAGSIDFTVTVPVLIGGYEPTLT